jgi:hypothetical protein
MNFENAFLGPRSIQVCHLRSKTPLTSVDRLRGPPRPIQRGRWPLCVPRRRRKSRRRKSRPPPPWSCTNLAVAAMALHGSGHRRHGHRAQQLAAMALRTAARSRCSARRHGRARGRGKRGRKLPPDEDSAPPEPIVTATTWGPRGAARALRAARVCAEPRAAHAGAGARPPPKRCGRRGPAARAAEGVGDGGVASRHAWSEEGVPEKGGGRRLPQLAGALRRGSG